MECPICKEYDEKDNFACPECSRDAICGSHYNFDFLTCSECADKKSGATTKKTKKVKKTDALDNLAAEVEEEMFVGDPFYKHAEKCPVCSTTNQQQWFKAKTYSDRDVDVDKHVGKVSWSEKGCESFHPPLYVIWHCPNCHYADAYNTYANPMKDPYSNFRELKDVYIDKYNDDGRIEKIVDKLGENIDYDKINHYHAIKLHMLAIFIQELIDEKEERDSFKLGRYYVRLAWLYRELDKLEDNEKMVGTLTKLLAFLKKGWPEVPINEYTALKKAIEYLSLAFTNSNAIKSISAEVDLLLWVAGIYMKMEDNDNALKYFNMVLSRGQKSKQKIEARLKEVEKGEKQMSADDIRSWDKQLKVIDNLMGKGRDTMADIKAEKLKEEKKKANDILKGLKEDMPPLDKRAILIKKGIDKSLAAKLTPEQKKKFLGLF